MFMTKGYAWGRILTLCIRHCLQGNGHYWCLCTIVSQWYLLEEEAVVWLSPSLEWVDTGLCWSLCCSSSTSSQGKKYKDRVLSIGRGIDLSRKEVLSYFSHSRMSLSFPYVDTLARERVTRNSFLIFENYKRLLVQAQETSLTIRI